MKSVNIYLHDNSISDLQEDYSRITDDVSVLYNGSIEDYEDFADYMRVDKIIKGVRL